VLGLPARDLAPGRAVADARLPFHPPAAGSTGAAAPGTRRLDAGTMADNPSTLGGNPETTPGGHAGRSSTLRDVWILYRREIRSALRERTIVVNSILIPILLYPFILWAMFTGITFVQGQTEGYVSRIMVSSWPQGHAALKREIERDTRIQLVPPRAAAAADEQVRAGDLDAVAAFVAPAAGAAALPDNFQLRVTFNKSKERSAAALDRITAIVDRYREGWLSREAASRGITEAGWQVFSLEGRNLASNKQMGAFLLGLMLPLFFVIMVAVGCFYPAVDATAGERERNTWETLMTVAASRGSIVTAKYLYVATVGGVAGLLNLTAMTLSMKPILAPLIAKTGEALEFSVPLGAIPVMAAAAVLLAGFVAAGMMIFASFARTFKEGQSMITPFYMLILIPVMFLQVPGLEFSYLLAAIPVINVTMMIREAISGTFHWPQIGVTLAVSAAVIAALLRLATFILRFEDVMIGSYGGRLASFVRERVLKGAKKPAGASQGIR
jgi:sodium transport system permease protein